MGVAHNLLLSKVPPNLLLLQDNMMKFSLACLLLLSAVAGSQGMNVETTPAREECQGFECPNDNEEGGLFQLAPCSPEFCDCSYGVPYKLTCEDPLVFDEEAQVCNWCYNMCDKCSDCGGLPMRFVLYVFAVK